MTKMVARIHPYNPSQGYFRRRHIRPPYTFRVEKGWYEVDPTTAEVLKGEYNNDGDTTSRPVFIVACRRNRSNICRVCSPGATTTRKWWRTSPITTGRRSIAPVIHAPTCCAPRSGRFTMRPWDRSVTGSVVSFC